MKFLIGKIAACVTTWLVTSAAAAQQLPDLKPSEWARRPTDEHFRAAWPKQATAPILRGEAGMECAPDVQGLLTECKLLYETPANQGFGAAALGLATTFQMKHEKRGAPFPAIVRIPLEFEFPFDTPVDWLKKPTAQNLLAVWPSAALKMGQGGFARITCLVSVQGLLYECKIRKEEPVGAGFGRAAIAVTPQLLMRPATLKGKAVVGVVTIPMRFPDFQPPQSASYELTTVRMLNADRDWIEAPTYADVAAAYPEKSRARRVGGYVNLNCTLSKEGRLRNCTTINEEPKGQGFSEAAKILAKQFRADPSQPDGKSLAGASIQLPIAFPVEMLGDAVPVLGKVKWAGMPSLAQVEGGYPIAAEKAGLAEGRAVLSCMVQPAGKLACDLKSEEPAGYGFGKAALSTASYFRMVTWTMEGLPTIGGAVVVPLWFKLAAKDVAVASPPAVAKP